MTLTWTHENPPQWDATKQGQIGALAPGSLGVDKLSRFSVGDLLPGDWWRVEAEDEVVGYGWMDSTWGDAEILLVVDPGHQGKGVGTFILAKLEEEARTRGFFYIYNVLPTQHPDAEGVASWLGKRNFSAHADGSLRRSVVRAS